MPPSLPVSVGTSGTILLIEDYDALAVAFGSTLRRLAPVCETIVVRSLAEAERAAKVAQPDLFVIDFDPPQSGAIDFFNRIKAAHPSARVLVIAASTWPKLPHERIRRGAFEFIEKPFELAKFGSLVNSLLAPPHSEMTGALRDLDLTDMIVLFGVSGATTSLTVTATSGASGEIQFVAGQMTQASVIGKTGVAALQEMLAWPAPRFAEGESRDESPRTIRGSWISVLQEGLRAAQTSAVTLEMAREVPDEIARPTKRIVVIDDTELLLIFVGEILRNTRAPLEVTTAPAGLEGIQRTLEVIPDLILLDYSLPDITGDEVCRRLNEDARTADIPVLMMSGHVAEMKATAERFSNVVATLAKPFLAAELIHLVEGLLYRKPEVLAEGRVKSASRRGGKKSSTTKAANGSPKAAPANPPVASPSITEVPPASEPETAPEDPAPLPDTKKNETELVRPDAPEIAEAEALISPTEPVAAPSSDAPVEPEIAAAPEEPENAEHPPKTNAPDGSLLSEDVESLFADPIKPEPDSRGALAIAEPAAPARIPDAKNNAVVLALPLEVTSIHFSPALQAKAVRAKPYSSLVFMHILPDALLAGAPPARTFELDQVDLDLRGQISGVRLTPSEQPVAATPIGSELVVADVVAYPTNGGGTMEVTPSAAEPMRIQLLVLFELVAVELTAELGVQHLILKARGAHVRLNLRPGATGTGITFQAAQVLLDRSARIAEVLLDALA